MPECFMISAMKRQTQGHGRSWSMDAMTTVYWLKTEDKTQDHPQGETCDNDGNLEYAINSTVEGIFL